MLPWLLQLHKLFSMLLLSFHKQIHINTGICFLSNKTVPRKSTHGRVWPLHRAQTLLQGNSLTLPWSLKLVCGDLTNLRPFWQCQLFRRYHRLNKFFDPYKAIFGGFFDLLNLRRGFHVCQFIVELYIFLIDLHSLLGPATHIWKVVVLMKPGGSRLVKGKVPPLDNSKLFQLRWCLFLLFKPT